jgi:alanine racemase
MGVRGTIEISHAALRHNLTQIRGRVQPTTEIVAVIKANAYGHGAVEVARTLAAEGVRWLGVATLGEAVELRDAGIRSEILLFENAAPVDAATILEYRLVPVVRDLVLATALSRAGERKRAEDLLPWNGSHFIPVHIEVETGMHRSGVTLEDYPQFLAGLSELKNVRMDGVFSHLGSSEVPHCRRTDRQIKLFREFVRLTQTLGMKPRYFHLANSGGVFLDPRTHFDMVRPGISLYGLPKMMDGLVPSLTFKTRIVETRKVRARELVGYGKTYMTHADTMVATLPVGYGDGYPRILSNRAYALVRGQRVPVVGRVSMDLMTLDVNGHGARVGDEVVLIGRQDAEEISAEELAHWADMIPYEITTALSLRLPRVVTQ